MKANFFLDDSDTSIYAAIGDMADDGLFRISVSPPDEHGRWQSRSSWQFLIPNTRPWDAAHQRIYNTHRVMVLGADEIEALPEVPPVPSYEPVRWADNFRPARAVLSTDYPELSAFIEQRTLRRAVHSIDVHLILSEDHYESSFGDGTFVGLDQAFPENHWHAADCMARGKKGQTLYLRRATITLEDGCLCLERGAFDHWRDVEVFAALERHIDPATAPNNTDGANQGLSRIILP